MEKRLILAVTLSIILVMAWSALTPRPSATLPAPNSTPQVSVPLATSLETTKVIEPKQKTKVRLDNFELNFNDNEATIQEVNFKGFRLDNFMLNGAFLLGEDGENFRKQSITGERAIFEQKDDKKTIKKEFIFSKVNNSIELDIEWHNLGPEVLRSDFPIVLGVIQVPTDNSEAQFQGVAVQLADKMVHTNIRSTRTFEKIKFCAIRNRYYCMIVQPDKADYNLLLEKIDGKSTRLVLKGKEIVLAPNQALVEKFQIYLGPQDLKLISGVNPDWGVVVNYGTFDIISQMLLQFLGFLHGLVHNWGIAIILLSILIYLFLYPLTLKQLRSMKDMQILQPKIEQLKESFKDNPQRLNKEIMELYRKHKVNPLGGCLPMVLQIPIFFALYQALVRSISLKGANFLWIKDLSQPDRLIVLPNALPFIGTDINILPIVMAIGMFFQQKITMVSAGGGSSAEQQRVMLIVMPIIFGFIFYRMPSGLVLYWFVNSLLTLANQLRINKAVSTK